MATDTITLREHFDLRFNQLEAHFEELRKADMETVKTSIAGVEKLNKTIHDGSQEAIKKAEESQRVYNQGHNDLSRKMEDQYKQMLPREEMNAVVKSLDGKIDALDKKIDALSLLSQKSEGKSEGVSRFVYLIFGAAGFIAAIITIVIMLSRK